MRCKSGTCDHCVNSLICNNLNNKSLATANIIKITFGLYRPYLFIF